MWVTYAEYSMQCLLSGFDQQTVQSLPVLVLASAKHALAGNTNSSAWQNYGLQVEAAAIGQDFNLIDAIESKYARGTCILKFKRQVYIFMYHIKTTFILYKMNIITRLCVK